MEFLKVLFLVHYIPFYIQRVFFNFVDRFTALGFMPTGVLLAARHILIFPMNQLA
jgi:hypothetical protein